MANKKFNFKFIEPKNARRIFEILKINQEKIQLFKKNISLEDFLLILTFDCNRISFCSFSVFAEFRLV